VIVSDDVRRLITAPTTLDIPTMKGKARLLTLPRAIANADSNAAVTALANPVTKNFSGWRTLLRGEKVTSTNAVINGAKKMMIPRILDIMSNPSSTTILLLTSPHIQIGCCGY